jgi:hypothetical protein
MICRSHANEEGVEGIFAACRDRNVATFSAVPLLFLFELSDSGEQ